MQVGCGGFVFWVFFVVIRARISDFKRKPLSPMGLEGSYSILRDAGKPVSWQHRVEIFCVDTVGHITKTDGIRKQPYSLEENILKKAIRKVRFIIVL